MDGDDKEFISNIDNENDEDNQTDSEDFLLSPPLTVSKENEL